MLTALLAYFLFVLYDASVKFGQQPPVTPFVIMATVGFTSATILTCYAFFRKSLIKLRPTRWLQQSGAALSTVVMSLSIIIALKHLPLTYFYVLFFTTPLVIAALSGLLKHEGLTATKIACLVIGFIGTFIAIGMPDGSRDWIGHMAVLMGIMGFSSRALVVRHLGKSVTAESTLILCNLVVGTTGAIGCIYSLPEINVTYRALSIFVFSGVMSALGGILYFRAIQNTLSTNVAQLQYSQIIFGAIIGYILWQEMPTWNLILGSAIITASGMYLAARGQKNTDASVATVKMSD